MACRRADLQLGLHAVNGTQISCDDMCTFAAVRLRITNATVDAACCDNDVQAVAFVVRTPPRAVLRLPENGQQELVRAIDADRLEARPPCHALPARDQGIVLVDRLSLEAQFLRY